MSAVRKPTPRVSEAPGFLLHSSPWRETSLLLETYTRDHGRVVMVAKGARRPTSALRPVLSMFQPLLLSWSGAGEVKTLTRADWCAALRVYGGPALMAAWYLNELVLRLLPREDAHPVLYEAYDEALQRLASGNGQTGAVRRFEWVMLREAGYGIDAPTPDFDDLTNEPALRKELRVRIEAQLEGRALVTRQVAQALQRWRPRELDTENGGGQSR